MPTGVHELELADGRRISLRRGGGDGAPLVLLHGLLDCAESWESFGASSGTPWIAFDLPGFGGSDLPSRPRISAYAEDVLAGLRQLRVARYALVGHSLGGAVATAMAEMSPPRATALALVAPAGFGRIHLAEAVSIPGIRNLTQALLPLALASPRTVGLAYTAVVANGLAIDADTLSRTLERASRATPGAREATKAVVAAGLSQHAFHRRVVAYPGPVHAVWGDRDRLVPPSHADGVTRAFPQAVVEHWRDVGHHPLHECPQRLMRFVRAALSTEPVLGAARRRAA